MTTTFVYLATICVTLSQHTLSQTAAPCDAEACTLTNNCQCSTVTSPLTNDATPQLVSLVFDETLEQIPYEKYLQPLLFNRTNPDGVSISATFFFHHSQTNYRIVHDLYVRGFEIGTKSISGNNVDSYWNKATEETLTQEFQGQKTIISHFANVPLDDIVGVRNMELQSDLLIKVYTAAGLQYDTSWKTPSSAPFFPYTLDYASLQNCTIYPCLEECHPGFWISPIVQRQIFDSKVPQRDCGFPYGCILSGTVDEIADWFEEQVVNNYNRVPITMVLESAWFRAVDNAHQGLQKFMDKILTRGDVFFVSQRRVIEWAKNPVPLDEFRSNVPARMTDCDPLGCPNLTEEEDELVLHYMEICSTESVGCPEVYPWVGNPLGKNKTTMGL